jgi:hypothetical protein
MTKMNAFVFFAAHEMSRGREKYPSVACPAIDGYFCAL